MSSLEPRLLDLLAEHLEMPPEQLVAILDRPQAENQTPLQTLLGAGLAEWPVCQAFAEHLGVPLVHVDPQTLDAGVVALIPHEVAAHHQVLPLSVEGELLTLAMADPVDVIAEDVVRFATHLTVRRVMAPPSEIEAGLRRTTADESSLESILGRIPETDLEVGVAEDDQAPVATDDLHTRRPIIALVNKIITQAITMGASDIHIEPMESLLRVRYRIDGVLRTVVELPSKVQNACISRLKLVSGMDIAEHRVPQDGRVRINTVGREVDLRVSSLPGSEGEKIVMRILDRRKTHVGLAELGFQERDQSVLLAALEAPQGLVLVTGPTGSGKTTTLYAALSHLNSVEDNLITVEDPIEYRLAGITQVAIRPKSGLTFARTLRAILRQDPDVVMVGEIRDSETAEIALQAAQTGHLVLSTLHTNDAASTVTRLFHMGIPSYLVASSLQCVLSQRLVRRLCPDCREVAELSSRELAWMQAVANPPQQQFVGRGCAGCDFTGYRGRLGLYEVLFVTERIRGLILSNASGAAINQAAREEGTETLLSSGLRRVAEGVTSMSEVLRVVTPEMEGGRHCLQCQLRLEEDWLVCPICAPGVDRFCPVCHRGARQNWLVCPFCENRLAPVAQRPVRVDEPTRAVSPALSPQDSDAGSGTDAENPPILVVCDEPLQRKVLGTILERAGLPTVAPIDLDETRKRLGSQAFRLLLLDHEAAGRTEVLGLWRSTLATSLLPWILLTRRGPEGLAGLDLGADDYLLKPVDPRQVLMRVTRLTAKPTRK